MNIELRRYGIVIKSTRITGEKASIGSGAGCDIQIEDPYLSAHVGDLVKRGDTWYITDAGTSLDGIQRDGERIDDEALVDGQVYSIGGFELVPQTGAPANAPRPTQAAPARSAMIPGTIVEPLDFGARKSDAVIPGTVVEPIPDFRRKDEIPKTVFEQPMPTRPAPVVTPRPMPQGAAAAAPAKRPRFLLVGIVGAVLLLFLLLIVAVGGGKKKKPVTTATAAPATAPATATTTTTPAPAPVAVAHPADLLRSLRYDSALKAWETQLATNDDPQIRARYADLALEVGRIHAANQSPDARAYFERAVKFGPAGSEAVAEAKRRLGN